MITITKQQFTVENNSFLLQLFIKIIDYSYIRARGIFFTMRLSILFCLLCLFTLCQPASLFGQIDSTNLPLFIIDTKGVPIRDEPKISGELKIIYNENQYNHPKDSATIYDGNIGIEIRGRYSASLPQKPYGIETRDSLGENLNVPLFQMPAENDWILLANYNDKTFMRNSLAFELFRKMGHYAPRTQFVELIVNGYYGGIYVFTEKIKRDLGRVNISKLSADENSGDDLSGGYIIKVDYFNDYDSWTSNYAPLGQFAKNVHFVFDYPEPESITSIQQNYIKNYINEFETTLYSPNTPERRQTLSKYIDLDSFIDYFILNELARNVDGYKKSSYFHKDKDSDGGQLHAGPVWDFDWAWKNINECFFGATDGSGWAYLVHQCDPWPVPPTWMTRLLQDPYFTQKVNERYFSLRGSFLSEAYIFNYIDSVANLLDEPQKRHYDRWRILGSNVGAPEVDPQPTTYTGEITKFKHWISTRLNWLDANIPNFVVTGLEQIEPGAPILLYPNPATSQIAVQSKKKIRDFTFYSIDGKVMKTENREEATSFFLDIEDLSPGFYMLKSTFTDGSSWIEKFVKTNY